MTVPCHRAFAARFVDQLIASAGFRTSSPGRKMVSS
jgi:hypothetical protein